MENVLQVTNNQVTISTLIIAKYTEKEHKNLRELIEDNISDFNEFGILEPIIEKPNKGSLGGKPTKLYLLNEQQYSLLMTFLRNNTKVKEFKKNMVKAFFEMKKQVENQKSLVETNIQIELSELRQEIKELKKQLVLKEKDENPFKGFYTPNWTFRKRENEYAYTRMDWMLLLNECERTLVAERQNRKYKQLLISGASK
ncbi:Rha family transcriptional regulator [Aliarcobacter butzleri]